VFSFKVRRDADVTPEVPVTPVPPEAPAAPAQPAQASAPAVAEEATSGATATATATATAADSDDRTDTQTGSIHVVRAGESLWSIARELLPARATSAQVAAEVARLWNLNQNRIGSGDPKLILPGERLRIS
jgi:nucleoid-associated protein YgaU